MSDNKERVYAPMAWKQPHDAAPEFVKAKVGINVDDFKKFLDDHRKEDGWVNLEMKEAPDGRYYFELDTWVPKPKAEEDDLAF